MLRNMILSISLVTLGTVACGGDSTPPPSSSAKTGKPDPNAGGSSSGSAGFEKNSPLGALFGSGDQKTPAQIRMSQVGQLYNEAGQLNAKAQTYERQCFSMTTDIINRDASKLILPWEAKTGAGGLAAGIGQLGIGALSAGLAGGKMSSAAGAIGQAGSDAFKSFGDGLSADLNKKDIKEAVRYIDGQQTAEAETCRATAKNLRAQASAKMKQADELNALGTE